MGSYDIAISGLRASQTALDIIGNNIANAATEGFHRQSPDLRTAGDAYYNGVRVGQGVNVERVVRQFNGFVESEMLNQEGLMQQLGAELESLTTIESSFSELSSEALSGALMNFFDSIHRLSEYPQETVSQESLVLSAESLAGQIQNLSEVISRVNKQVYTEAQATMDEVNTYAEQVAELNGSIETLMITGEDVNNLLDQRDLLITKISRLVGVTRHDRGNGVVDVSIGSILLVSGEKATQMNVELVEKDGEQNICVSPEGSNVQITSLSGGRIAGLANLNNDILREVNDQLDKFAGTLINEINRLHVQGVGANGSFSTLTGWQMDTDNLADINPPITDGSIYIRLTDETTGEIRRFEVPIATTDTMSDVATAISAITGLNAAVNDGVFNITADAGYKFDFIPGVMASPMEDDIGFPGSNYTLTGQVPQIDISGDYTGAGNTVYTATVNGTGTIGAGALTVTFDNGVNSIVVNVGDGYEPGTKIAIADGIEVSFGAGELNNGEIFKVNALESSDTTDFLAAVGMNCFFAGTDATSIAISDHINVEGGGMNIATSRTAWLKDNTNLLAMVDLDKESLADLGGLTIKEYYTSIASGIGRKVATTQTREENAYSLWRSIGQQRDQLSGVDMNDEAAKMMVFERMFQGVAKYLSTVNTTLDTLMGLVG